VAAKPPPTTPPPNLTTCLSERSEESFCYQFKILCFSGQ